MTLKDCMDQVIDQQSDCHAYVSRIAWNGTMQVVIRSDADSGIRLKAMIVHPIKSRLEDKLDVEDWVWQACHDDWVIIGKSWK